MFAAFLAAVFFALSAILAHRTSRMVGVVAANCARLWVAAVFLALWAHLCGHGLSGKGMPTYFLSGIIGFGVGDIGLFAALPRIGSRLTALMVQCLASPIAATIEWLWLGVRPSQLDLLCGAVILLGVGIAVAPDRGSTALSTKFVSPADAVRRRAGLLFGLMAATGQAAGAVTSRKAFFITHAAGGQIDGGTAAYQRVLGGVLVVTFAFLAKRRFAGTMPQPSIPWRAASPWIVANGLVGATVGVSFFQWALATTPTAVVLPIVALTPLFVIPFAYVFEGERPGVRSLLGGAVAVAGAVMLARWR